MLLDQSQTTAAEAVYVPGTEIDYETFSNFPQGRIIRKFLAERLSETAAVSSSKQKQNGLFFILLLVDAAINLVVILMADSGLRVAQSVVFPSTTLDNKNSRLGDTKKT